ncbi:MAG: hypothetical protein KDE14_07295 [Rhodobacteraceae bacterium]|nr:hypothetical protein [Paracoccaceae bacterium]
MKPYYWLAAMAVGLALGLTLGLASVSAPVRADDDGASKAAPAQEEKLICKRINTTGSRIGGGRICQTKEKWDAESRDAQQRLRDMNKVQGATKGG